MKQESFLRAAGDKKNEKKIIEGNEFHATAASADTGTSGHDLVQCTVKRDVYSTASCPARAARSAMLFSC